MIRILKEVAFRFGYKCTSFPDPLFSENRIFPENTPFFRPFSEKTAPFFGNIAGFFTRFSENSPNFPLLRQKSAISEKRIFRGYSDHKWTVFPYADRSAATPRNGPGAAIFDNAVILVTIYCYNS
ncbi:hypothetical protein [Alistipes dispar]|uniref:hypothetical protein n=1 Tax=Alistipes dispar TaxID=2585119 RepID=UPI002FDDF9C0